MGSYFEPDQEDLDEIFSQSDLGTDCSGDDGLRVNCGLQAARFCGLVSQRVKRRVAD